ncbi:MAG TPA: NAD(P)/FAD-dependent oxidoreductase [Myxococcales bacterium]|nr:NAD(P)/FAD-dependent oxidoreductase [Myxococcales bacterium]
MSSESQYDAIIVGAGPNGLSAAIRLAQHGASVLLIEAKDSVGGGTRSGPLTLPGFVHDYCSAVHPMGALSPYLQSLPLEEYGLKWCYPDASVAHPLDNGRAALLSTSMDATIQSLGPDGEAWKKLVSPFLKAGPPLFEDFLAPFRVPKRLWTMMRFAWLAFRSAKKLADGRFQSDEAKALFAGCAGHSILPLEQRLTAAVGLVFAISGHLVNWPVAQGGSHAISQSMAQYFQSLGGQIQLNTELRSIGELPPTRQILLDLVPKQVIKLCSDVLPAHYLKRLNKYRYGPGTFKMDWALSGPIPWTAGECLQASTVHVGNTLNEICASERDAWKGRHSDNPFLIVCQQSQFDATRAPNNQHTGYAYCHVPNGSTVDMSHAIETQIERFAPGFRDLILAKKVTTPLDFAQYNPGYVGGAITGGAADLGQLFTRPVARFNPYTTPNKQILLCSHATPPGGGVHGMCGFYSAGTALRRLKIKA